LADKDDLIGTRTIPLTSIVKKDREKRIDLKDKAGKLVKGKDGQTTAIFLRLAGTRTQKSGSILDVPGDAVCFVRECKFVSGCLCALTSVHSESVRVLQA
jgi:hypothetical protein